MLEICICNACALINYLYIYIYNMMFTFLQCFSMFFLFATLIEWVEHGGTMRFPLGKSWKPRMRGRSTVVLTARATLCPGSQLACAFSDADVVSALVVTEKLRPC